MVISGTATAAAKSNQTGYLHDDIILLRPESFRVRVNRYVSTLTNQIVEFAIVS